MEITIFLQIEGVIDILQAFAFICALVVCWLWNLSCKFCPDTSLSQKLLWIVHFRLFALFIYFFRTLWLWKTFSKQLQCNCHLLVAFVVVFVSKCNFLFMQMSPEQHSVPLGSPSCSAILCQFVHLSNIENFQKSYTNIVKWTYILYVTGKKRQSGTH